MQNCSSYFKNTSCEFFPCHKTSEEDFNCLFCFCPLYKLDCKGSFTYTKNGIKDCSNCLIPHSKNGYEYIMSFLKKDEE